MKLRKRHIGIKPSTRAEDASSDVAEDRISREF